jgi:hypothetical protein
VDRGTDRDVAQRQGVADLDVGLGPDSTTPDLEVLRREDVALLAVVVVQQRDAGRPVGVVLDRRDRRGHAVLVATEVDDAVLALVPAAAVAAGDAAVDVAARLLRQRRGSDFSGVDA